MVSTKEKEFLKQLNEEIERIINKKGLSKIDPLASFKSVTLIALERLENKNRKRGSVRTLRGGSTGLVQQKNKR